MNYLRALLLLSSCLFICSSFAQKVVGTTFPEMETETVEDEVVVLPKDKQDKITLVGLAYSKKSEDDLITWFSPVYHKFIKEQEGLFAGFGYDVNVFFVPMFTGVNAAATGTAKKQAAKKFDPLLLPHILFYKGKLKPYKEALAFDKKDVPYFFVIDQEGKILYATTGAYTESKMSQVESHISE